MVDLAARALVQYEVEQFLYQEARLLDERRLADWLALFTHDATYAMPTGDPDLWQNREDRTAIGLPESDYDKAFLTLVVQRLETQATSAERPASVTRHLISNVQVEPTDSPDELRARSGFAVFQTRPGRF